MFGPVKAILSVRTSATPALLVAAASIALHFAATPFLIPVIAERFGVSLGVAGLISVAQVGGFTASNLFAGRRLQPRHSLLVWSAAGGVVFNVASAIVDSFEVLVGLRILAGVAAGLVTWLAWTEAMRNVAALKDVAGSGPLVALIGSPAVAWLLTVADERMVFIVIGASCIPALFMKTAFGSTKPRQRRRMSPSRSNVVLLASLGMLSGAGSSLYIYAASIGADQVGLQPVAVSLAFSANAGAGLLATRRHLPGVPHAAWFAVVSVCIVMIAFIDNPISFYVAMAVWGYAFWQAVPAVLAQIAAWSLVPEERTGDAQGVMAFGRMIGPAVGGALLSVGSFAAVGIEAAAGVFAASLAVAAVGRYRNLHPEERPTPTH